MKRLHANLSVADIAEGAASTRASSRPSRRSEWTRAQPMSAHWGQPDPAAGEGSDVEKMSAFGKRKKVRDVGQLQ